MTETPPAPEPSEPSRPAEPAGGAVGAPTVPAEYPEPSGNTCRSCGLGCLGILVLFGIGLAVTTANASAALDARQVQVAEEIVALQKEVDVRRATVLGQPDNDENALVDYNGLQWAMAGGNTEHLPRSWATQRPVLPADIDEMTAKVAPDGKEIDYMEPVRLIQSLEDPLIWKNRGETGELSEKDEKKLRQAEAVYARFKPALRYLRDGLARGKCDWKPRWEQGMRLEIPNLIYMRNAANFMAYEASVQEPRDAIQTGLEIVAFGQDLSKQGTLIGGMIGIAVSSIGFQSLARTLSRPGLVASDYQRVIDALATYTAPDIGFLLTTERTTAVVTSLEMSGRRLDDAGSGAYMDDVEMGYGTKAISKLDVFHARELEGFEIFMAKAIEVARLPVQERQAAQDALEIELSESYYIIAKITIPNLTSAGQNLEQSLAMARVTRALAAAQLYRLDQGSFPPNIQDLSDQLGEGIHDPTAANPKAPLGYYTEAGLARSWFAGDDGVDNGGPFVRGTSPKKKRKKKKGGTATGKKKNMQSRVRPNDDRGLEVRVPLEK